MDLKTAIKIFKNIYATEYEETDKDKMENRWLVFMK